MDCGLSYRQDRHLQLQRNEVPSLHGLKGHPVARPAILTRKTVPGVPNYLNLALPTTNQALIYIQYVYIYIYIYIIYTCTFLNKLRQQIGYTTSDRTQSPKVAVITNEQVTATEW